MQIALIVLEKVQILSLGFLLEGVEAYHCYGSFRAFAATAPVASSF